MRFMSKFFLLLFPILFSIQLQAQITFETSDLPVSGTAYSSYFSLESPQFPMPKTGANMNWDYSGILSTKSISYSYTKSSSEIYKDATLLMTNRMDTSVASYFLKPGQHGLYFVSEAKDNAPTEGNQEELMMAAPISYGQTIVDSSRFVEIDTFNNTVIKFFRFVRQKYTALGYGSIVTSSERYDNTLLVERKLYTYDSTQFIGYPETVARLDTFIIYSWMQKDNMLPVVFEIQIIPDSSGNRNIISAYSSKQALSPVADPNKSIGSIHYPMPADQQVTIQFPEHVTGSLVLYGVDGQEKLNKKLYNSAGIILETSALPSGIYNYQVFTEKGNYIKNNLMVVH